MNKLVLAFAACAAFVSVASADSDWFNGNIGSETGGSWAVPSSGVTTNGTTLVLEDVESELKFTATSQKTLSGSENLIFTSSATFSSAYDEFPEIPSGAKAGVIAFEGASSTNYYVLAKDTTTNKWTDTGIKANLASAVTVLITVTNGTDGTHALYKFGDNTVVDEVVVTDNSAWGSVSYLGSGEVATLVGTTHSNGYPIPGGGDPIPTDTANQWAEDNGYSQDDLAKMLSDTTAYTGGRTPAQSCILGVATNADVTASVADTNASVITFSVNCTPISGRATFTLKKGDDIAVSPQSSKDFEVTITDSTDGKYTIYAQVDGAATLLPVSQTIGVKSTAVGSGAVAYIAVPWSNCEAGDLLKNSICANGDKLEAYDPDSNSYKTWQYNGSAWEFAGTGTVPTLVKGQAVKYTRVNTAADATMVAIGDVSSATTTAIKKGAAKWNLVAMPEGDSIKASKIPLDSNQALAIQLGDNGITPTKIIFKAGAGYYYRNSWGGTVNLVDDSVTVEGGFFLKTISTDSVDWSSCK